MTPIKEINRIKALPIVDYLASKGFKPVRMHGKEHVYFSPIRDESTPSFFVNPDKNLYQDFGQAGGDIIKLVMELYQTDFLSAINVLKNWKPGNTDENDGTGSCSGIIKNFQPSGEIRIVKIRNVQHQALVNYLGSRSIPFSFAAKYLKEVHYENKGKRFFSIGFKNDNGGWALRNAQFKNCIGAQGITYLPVPASTAISVFEGFFDFLSALVYYDVESPQSSVLVLNSTSNLKAAHNILFQYQAVYTYMDNDPAGINAVKSLRSLGNRVIDRSGIYSGFKDFSEMINASR
jgi:hypothetical protein